MLLAIYKVLIAAHWIFVYLLAFSMILFIILMNLSSDTIRNLFKRKPAFKNESSDDVSIKKIAMHTRVKITLILSFIYFMLVFFWLQTELLVQTQCVLNHVETNSKGLPKHIFVTYTVDNKQYSEKVITYDTTIYNYSDNMFTENSSKLCWYDRLDPSRVMLEPIDFVRTFSNLVYSFVVFIAIMLIVQWGISQYNKMIET